MNYYIETMPPKKVTKKRVKATRKKAKGETNVSSKSHLNNVVNVVVQHPPSKRRRQEKKEAPKPAPVYAPNPSMLNLGRELRDSQAQQNQFLRNSIAEIKGNMLVETASKPPAPEPSGFRLWSAKTDPDRRTVKWETAQELALPKQEPVGATPKKGWSIFNPFTKKEEIEEKPQLIDEEMIKTYYTPSKEDKSAKERGERQIRQSKDRIASAKGKQQISQAEDRIRSGDDFTVDFGAKPTSSEPKTPRTLISLLTGSATKPKTTPAPANPATSTQAQATNMASGGFKAMQDYLSAIGSGGGGGGGGGASSGKIASRTRSQKPLAEKIRNQYIMDVRSYASKDDLKGLKAFSANLGVPVHAQKDIKDLMNKMLKEGDKRYDEYYQRKMAEEGEDLFGAGDDAGDY